MARPSRRAARCARARRRAPRRKTSVATTSSAARPSNARRADGHVEPEPADARRRPPSRSRARRPAAAGRRAAAPCGAASMWPSVVDSTDERGRAAVGGAAAVVLAAERVQQEAREREQREQREERADELGGEVQRDPGPNSSSKRRPLAVGVARLVEPHARRLVEQHAAAVGRARHRRELARAPELANTPRPPSPKCEPVPTPSAHDAPRTFGRARARAPATSWRGGTKPPSSRARTESARRLARSARACSRDDATAAAPRVVVGLVLLHRPRPRPRDALADPRRGLRLARAAVVVAVAHVREAVAVVAVVAAVAAVGARRRRPRVARHRVLAGGAGEAFALALALAAAKQREEPADALHHGRAGPRLTHGRGSASGRRGQRRPLR